MGCVAIWRYHDIGRRSEVVSCCDPLQVEPIPICPAFFNYWGNVQFHLKVAKV